MDYNNLQYPTPLIDTNLESIENEFKVNARVQSCDKSDSGEVKR